MFPVNPFAGSDIVRALVFQVTAVTGANVTFAGLYLLNGPPSGSYQPLNGTENLDVQTQSWCDTTISPGGNRTFCSLEALPQAIIASGLTAPDAIGADPSVTLNLTLTRMVVGVPRTVNIFNETVLRPAYQSGVPCLSGGYGLSCSNATISYGFAWDQASGIEVGSTYSVKYNSTEGSAKGTSSLALVSTNIFASLSPQDFTIQVSPSIEFQTGSSGTATITLSSQSGFDSSITLTVDTPTMIACTLDHKTIQSSGIATLTCSGEPGTYTVTIYASSKYSTKQTQTNVKIDTLSTSNQPSNNFRMAYVFIAAAAVAFVTIVGAIAILKRRHPTITPVPAESPLSVP